MSKRHQKIGIKQGLRKEWLDKTLLLKLSGLPNHEIREELFVYLSDKLDNGSFGIRGRESTQIAVSMLSKIWLNPDKELIKFRNKLLEAASDNNYIQCHWAMLCAAYPFWYRTAKHTGRLLGLQKRLNKNVIIQRIKEEYGDRSSVIRSAQRVIQGFRAMGVIKKNENKNCCTSAPPINSSMDITILLYEAALHADKEGKLALGLLKNDPAFFPFKLPRPNADLISRRNNAIEVIRYGLDEELLTLRNQ